MPQLAISSPKPRFNLKYLTIILILVLIVGSGILYWFFLTQPKTGEVLTQPKTEEVKYISYRNILFNVSFQYPSTLHLIESSQKISTSNVCTGGIPPGPEYLYYDMCQRHLFEPYLSLISNNSKTIIEISYLDANSWIDNLKILWNAFLQQYFPETSFDKEFPFSLDVNKLPLDRSEGSESFASIYSSSNPSAPIIAFIPAFGLKSSPQAWVLILYDKKFQQAFDTIIQSFNLNNTVQLTKIDLVNGNSTTIDSPIYIAGFKFNDYYNQKMLFSDIEKTVIFDEKERKFIELFKFTEIKEKLKIDVSLYDWRYLSDVVFDRVNPNIIYGLIFNNIFQYNIPTKEAKIVYKGELPTEPLDLYPPIGKNLIIGSAYGDAGCFFKGISILNLDNKQVKEGWSESYCEGEENLSEKSIGISSNGRYLLISSKRNDYSDLYLYDNLSGKKSLLWSGNIPNIEGWMVGTYRFRFDDEAGNPKVYNLQSQEFESLSSLTAKALGPHYTPLAYNENGFVYGEGKKLYYLNYINGKLTPFYGIDAERLLFLTDTYAVAWK